MDKTNLSNGFGYIKISDATNKYKTRIEITKAIQMYFTPDLEQYPWTIIDSENTLIEDGGNDSEVDEEASGYQLLQCSWNINFRIKIQYFSDKKYLGIYFYDLSDRYEVENVGGIIASGGKITFTNPLFFNFILGASKKSFAFSCSNESFSLKMHFLCVNSETNKIGVFKLVRDDLDTWYDKQTETPLMYNGQIHPFPKSAQSPFIYRTWPILNNKNTIILPVISDYNGDRFLEVYHLISTSLPTRDSLLNALFQINDSIYRIVYPLQRDNSTKAGQYYFSGPFLLKIA